MTHLSIPSNWPAPKFNLGQSVKARGHKGHIVGIEFQGEDHYFVRCEGSELGWAYTIQADRDCPKYETDPLVTVDESEVIALALCQAVG
jgi:hypothetical protein